MVATKEVLRLKKGIPMKVLWPKPGETLQVQPNGAPGAGDGAGLPGAAAA